MVNYYVIIKFNMSGEMFGMIYFKKTGFLDKFINYITFFIAFYISDIVSNYLGIRGNNIFSLSFVEKGAVMFLCLFSTNFLTSKIKDILKKSKIISKKE